MKYTKHYTWKEWKKFNKLVAPDNSFVYFNFFTKKYQVYDTLTMQEVLLKKYKIKLIGYEPKWIRRYHSITKIINMKNFDKGMTSFSKGVQAFSNGMGEFEKDAKRDRRKHKDHHEQLWGKKRDDVSIWGKPKKFKF